MLQTSVLDRFKDFWQGVVLLPFVRLFIRLGISPDTVTFVGTVGVCTGALVFFPQGELLTGVLFITAFVFSDLIDGKMARELGRSSTFGSFWDSTLDRFGDGAIFVGLALYFAGPGDSYLYLCLSLYCLVTGSVTSYARAKAESLGLDARGGLAERADRLVLVLVLTGVGAIIDLVLLTYVALWVLAVASTITVYVRVSKVHRQAVERDATRDAVRDVAPGVDPTPAGAPDADGADPAPYDREHGRHV
nr:CDP-alcohol phosphatidyltransferase family protein [Nocardioides litoris]